MFYSKKIYTFYIIFKYLVVVTKFMVFDETWRKLEIRSAREQLRKLRLHIYEIKENLPDLSESHRKEMTSSLKVVESGFSGIERSLNRYIYLGKTDRTQSSLEQTIYNDIIKKIATSRNKANDVKLREDLQDLYDQTKKFERIVYNTFKN